MEALSNQSSLLASQEAPVVNHGVGSTAITQLVQKHSLRFISWNGRAILAANRDVCMPKVNYLRKLVGKDVVGLFQEVR
eukprot:12424380-Karenia_brevis.AAC.1